MKRSKLIQLLILPVVILLAVSSVGATLINDLNTSPTSYWGAVFSNPSLGDVNGKYYELISADVTKGAGLIVDIKGQYIANWLTGVIAGYAPGDLYLNSHGWVVTGNDPHHKTDVWSDAEGWDIVIKGSNFGRQVGTYNTSVYSYAGGATMTATPLFPVTPTPFPQAWAGGYGNVLTDATVTYLIDANDPTIGHVIFNIADISGLNLNGFGLHYTMRCGNDVIEGQVPEPTTILFLGLGLVGLGAVGFRRIRK